MDPETKTAFTQVFIAIGLDLLLSTLWCLICIGAVCWR
jgi:hypothetical protein